MKEFKIRCSQIGKIMGVKGIGLTGKGYCEDWYKEKIYSKRKSFTSKYTEKGNKVEDDSLDFIADNLGYGMIVKNEKVFYDDFMTGTPDAILKEIIIDVKNSWDCFTFPLFNNKTPNKDYYWQAQGYMNLTGIENYKLVYTLMNTPKELIEKEYIYSDQSVSFDDFEKEFTYDNIDPKYRIKVFDIKKNEDDIQKIKDRVNECREYISTLI
jgi:hypothetical protein